jgi:hypothetical protein
VDPLFGRLWRDHGAVLDASLAGSFGTLLDGPVFQETKKSVGAHIFENEYVRYRNSLGPFFRPILVYSDSWAVLDLKTRARICLKPVQDLVWVSIR